MSIPHHIHQIWLGPRPVPERWLDRWRSVHRRWEHSLWREADVVPILSADMQRAWDYYLSVGRWHGAADVARVAVLLEQGGVYADIDSQPLRRFDRAPFMQASFFAGLEGTRELPGFIANGIMGAEAGHPILATYRSMVASADQLEPPWNTVGGRMLSRAVAAHQGMPGVLILPPRTFYPESKTGQRTEGRERPYTRHYWATTYGLYDWQDESPKRLLRRRRPPPLPVQFRLRQTFRRVVALPVRRVGRALFGSILYALRRGMPRTPPAD